MNPDAVMRQIDATGGENDLLDLALGYQQMLDRVERASKRQAEISQSPDGNLVLVLMGVLSLKADLDRWLRTVDQTPKPSPEQSPDLPDSILR